MHWTCSLGFEYLPVAMLGSLKEEEINQWQLAGLFSDSHLKFCWFYSVIDTR